MARKKSSAKGKTTKPAKSRARPAARGRSQTSSAPGGAEVASAKPGEKTAQ